jgi:hypothetical protein
LAAIGAAGAAGFGAAAGAAAFAATGFAAAGLRTGALRAAGFRAAVFLVALRAAVLRAAGLRAVARLAALRAGAFFAPVLRAVLRAVRAVLRTVRAAFLAVLRGLAFLLVVRFFPLVLVAMACAPILLWCRTRPVKRTRSCTNHASLVQACRPTGRVNCFFQLYDDRERKWQFGVPSRRGFNANQLAQCIRIVVKKAHCGRRTDTAAEPRMAAQGGGQLGGIWRKA